MGIRGPPLEYWGAGFFFEIHVNSFVEKMGQIKEIQPEVEKKIKLSNSLVKSITGNNRLGIL